MQALIGVIVALAGILIALWSKIKTQSGLLDNIETKDGLIKTDESIAKNTALIEVEEENRKALEGSKPASSQDSLLDFLNKDEKK